MKLLNLSRHPWAKVPLLRAALLPLHQCMPCWPQTVSKTRSHSSIFRDVARATVRLSTRLVVRSLWMNWYVAGHYTARVRGQHFSSLLLLRRWNTCRPHSLTQQFMSLWHLLQQHRQVSLSCAATSSMLVSSWRIKMTIRMMKAVHMATPYRARRHLRQASRCNRICKKTHLPISSKVSMKED